MNIERAANAYQDVLKNSALIFLERHKCEHLSNDQQLRARAVQYLVGDYEVLTQLAEKVVDLACSEMDVMRDQKRLDVINSVATHALIVDPNTGKQWAVPVSLIYERVLNMQDEWRYRVANS